MFCVVCALIYEIIHIEVKTTFSHYSMACPSCRWTASHNVWNIWIATLLLQCNKYVCHDRSMIRILYNWLLPLSFPFPARLWNINNIVFVGYLMAQLWSGVIEIDRFGFWFESMNQSLSFYVISHKWTTVGWWIIAHTVEWMSIVYSQCQRYLQFAAIREYDVETR